MITRPNLNSPAPNPELEALLEAAKAHIMTPAETFAQRRSWVLGEMMLAHPEWTKEQAAKSVDDAMLRLGYEGPMESFQDRTRPWFIACFGKETLEDKPERAHRFAEEAIEFVQSLNVSRFEVMQLVDYVFGRPVGEPAQEVGGVLVTLAGACLANDLDMAACGETELARIWTKVEAIRAKRATKPEFGPLPIASNEVEVIERMAESMLNAHSITMLGETFDWAKVPGNAKAHWRDLARVALCAQAGDAIETRGAVKLATLQALAEDFADWASNNETQFTGWGEQEIPPEATLWRVKANQARDTLREIKIARRSS